MTTKNEIRERVWQRMEQEKVARFPFPIRGRIPNFKGAEEAASRVFQLAVYREATVVKVNPDSPQLPIRAQVLMDRKTLFVPTPRLRAGFIEVRPEWVPHGEERKAASLSHIKKYGKECALTDLPPIDLFVVGSVALTRDGRRIGKGEGYADREYAILRALGQQEIPVVSTVHHLQVVDDEIPRERYDLAVDWIATDRELIETNTPYSRPNGIEWDRVTQKEKKEMPVLKEVEAMLGRT